MYKKKYTLIILYCIVLHCIVLYPKKTAKFRNSFKFPPNFPHKTLKKSYCIVLYCIVLYCIQKNGEISQLFQISAQISTQNTKKHHIALAKKKIFFFKYTLIILYCIVLYCIVSTKNRPHSPLFQFF